MVRLRIIFITIASLSLLLVACNHGGTNNKDYDQDRTATSQISNLFSEGDRNAKMVTISQLTDPQKQTLKKFLKIEAADLSVRRLFDSVLNGSKSIQAQELSRRFGLTDVELDILLSIFDNKQTKSTQASLTVLTAGDNFSFKGTGELNVIDSLLISKKGTTASFKQTILTLQNLDTSQVANEFLPPGEGLNSTFVFNGSTKGGDTITSGTEYTVLIARLTKSGKTYIFLNTEIHVGPGQTISQFNSIILD